MGHIKETIMAMIALLFMQAVISGLMPNKKSNALNVVVGMTTLLCVLSVVGVIKNFEMEDFNYEVYLNVGQGEQIVVEQTIALTKAQIEDDVKKMAIEIVGEEPKEVEVIIDVKDEKIIVTKINVVFDKESANEGKLKHEVDKKYSIGDE